MTLSLTIHILTFPDSSQNYTDLVLKDFKKKKATFTVVSVLRTPVSARNDLQEGVKHSSEKRTFQIVLCQVYFLLWLHFFLKINTYMHTLKQSST